MLTPPESPLRRSQRHSRAHVSTVCGRCHVPVKLRPPHVVCSPCETALTNLARAEQERAYLHSYLHTRADDQSPTSKRLRQHCAAIGLDWRQPPPPLCTFAERLHRLMSRAA